jgi:hypothetical protein
MAKVSSRFGPIEYALAIVVLACSVFSATLLLSHRIEEEVAIPRPKLSQPSEILATYISMDDGWWVDTSIVLGRAKIRGCGEFYSWRVLNMFEQQENPGSTKAAIKYVRCGNNWYRLQGASVWKLKDRLAAENDYKKLFPYIAKVSWEPQGER